MADGPSCLSLCPAVRKQSGIPLNYWTQQAPSQVDSAQCQEGDRTEVQVTVGKQSPVLPLDL